MRETLAAALALLPGLLAWAWGRRLVRSADDPTLPERLIAWRQRSALAFATAAALLIVLLSQQVAWALPLLVLARLAGGFPARRALYQERWDFVAYLAHVVRATLGLGGFWLLLMLAPALVAWAGPAAWPTAAALACVLVAWGLAHPPVLQWLLGATRLARPELEGRFRAIAERSKAPQPRLLVIGPREGRWANAFALPATREPAVAFTRTLLEALDPDELAAIFAHEQAHLEHYDAPRVRRLAALQTLAALVATLGAAAALGRFEGTSLLFSLGWPLAVVAALVVRAVRHRAHEAESDRRAVELCGDAQALARALVKLHALALLPRRLDVEHERRATHPSLANRLRALEELAQAPGRSESGAPANDLLTEAAADPSPATAVPATAFRASVLAAAASGSWVLLDARHAHWLEGVPADTPRDAAALRTAAPRVRSLAYSELVTLRLRPRGRSGHALVATDRSGASWAVPLAAGEGATAHAALDAVDGRLAPHSAARPEYRGLGALVACTGALLALLLASVATLPALVALVLPHPGPLAGFGVAAVVAAVSGLAASATPALWLAPRLAPLAWLGLALLGVAALWLARSTAWRERAGRTRSAQWVGLGLALAAVLALIPTSLALVAGGALRAHLAARDHPAGAVLVLAAAATFVVVPRAWGRPVAGALGVVASLPLVLGTQAFAERFVRDPFFAPSASVPSFPTQTGRLLDEQPLPAVSGELLLSPSGRTWGMRRFDFGQDGKPPESRLVVGSASGAHYEYGASDLVLLDDALLLALFADTRRLAVEQRPHDPAAPAHWRVPLEPLSGVRLAADAASGHWRVVGIDADTGALVRVSGGRDGSSLVERWTPGTRAAAWVVGSGPAALGIAPRFGAASEALLEAAADEDAPGPWWWLLLNPATTGFGSRVFALDAGGARPLYESGLFVQCDEPGPDRAALLCRASDGARTSLWRVDPKRDERRPLAALEGLAWSAHSYGDGWLVLANAGRQQHLYRLEGERLERLDVGGTPPWIHAVAGFDGGVGVIVSDALGVRLRRWAVP